MTQNDDDMYAWSPQGPMIELSAAHCWDLLRQESLGRLAVCANDRPAIFPVNFYCDGATIVFRTADGTKLRDLTENASVAFEVDGRSRAESWSVLVDGAAGVVSDEEAIKRAERAPLPLWVPTATPLYVAIVVNTISGRRYSSSLTST